MSLPLRSGLSALSTLLALALLLPVPVAAQQADWEDVLSDALLDNYR